MQKLTKSVGLIVLAMLGGAVFGLVWPNAAAQLTPIAKLILQLIKAVAAPLVFLAVIEAILRYRVASSDFFKLITISFINVTCAISLGLLIANLFEPGQYLRPLISSSNAPTALKQMDVVDIITKQFPTSIVQPFADNSIMPIVLLALIIGFAWRYVRTTQPLENKAVIERAEILISFARDLTETILIWIVTLVPLAVFAATAKVTSENGLAAFKNLGQYAALCLLGMIIHIIFTYSAWLIFFVRITLLNFWKHALQPVLYAFSVNSSLVALPLTLRALDDLKVSRRASTLAACVGTNLNNDGIILYEGFTLLALAQAAGIEMSITSQIFAAIYCIVAAMGVAGVPEAGVVALTLVMSSLGLPTEALALLLSVDWIIARGRSLLNASSDMVGSMILNRWIEIDSSKQPSTPY